MNKALRLGQVPSVTLAGLSGFTWSELVLFSPYSDRARICADLALDEANCGFAPEHVDESRILLVFRHQGAVVHHELHERAHGEFRDSEDISPVSPARSTFDVERSPQGQGKPVRLVLVLR